MQHQEDQQVGKMGRLSDITKNRASLQNVHNCQEVYSEIKGGPRISDQYWLLSIHDNNLSYSLHILAMWQGS